eukprot:4482944-Pleurochrysis_carterae.AAC.1
MRPRSSCACRRRSNTAAPTAISMQVDQRPSGEECACMHGSHSTVEGAKVALSTDLQRQKSLDAFRHPFKADEMSAD